MGVPPTRVGFLPIFLGGISWYGSWVSVASVGAAGLLLGCSGELSGTTGAEGGAPPEPGTDDTPSGDSPEPEPTPQQASLFGSIGSWCGPEDDETTWLVLSAVDDATESCSIRASQIYEVEAAAPTDPADPQEPSDPLEPAEPAEPADSEKPMETGLALRLTAEDLSSLPTLRDVELRHCAAGSCRTLPAQLSVQSYVPGTRLDAELRYTLDGEEQLAEIAAGWCEWNEHLPPHPEADRLARDLTLREVALYQGVEIALAKDGAAVETRNAPVLQGRPALVRAFVEPGDEFEPREIQGRLIVSGSDGAEVRFEQTKVVASGSTKADLDGTFNFELPPDLLGDDSEVRVELFETSQCTPLTGAELGASYPEEGTAPLGAEYTGAVRVMLVPIVSTTAGSRMPNTSEELVEAWREQVFTLYPTTEVILEVRDPMYTDINIGDDGFETSDQVFDAWGEVLSDLRVLRSEDSAPRNLHYYGLLDPIQSRGAGGLAGEGRGSGGTRTAGTGVGLGRNERNAGIFAHELGHMHGLPHAPCGTVGNPDPTFPHANGGIGVWGYDVLTGALYDPAEHADMMGYCNQTWISDYYFDLIAERVALLNESAYVEPLASSSWRSLIIDSRGRLRWGQEYVRHSLPEGIPESAHVLDENGAVIGAVQVYRLHFQHWSGSILDVPAPRPGWAALQLAQAPPLRFDAPVRVPPRPRR